MHIYAKRLQIHIFWLIILIALIKIPNIKPFCILTIQLMTNYQDIDNSIDDKHLFDGRQCIAPELSVAVGYRHDLNLLKI